MAGKGFLYINIVRDLISFDSKGCPSIVKGCPSAQKANFAPGASANVFPANSGEHMYMYCACTYIYIYIYMYIAI